MTVVLASFALIAAVPLAAADTLGEAGAREVSRQALRQARPPSCTNVRAAEEREAALRTLISDNTIPIPICRASSTRVVTYRHGKIFLKVEVNQAGVVRDVNVTRVIGEPNLEAAAREEALGTRFFPVHQRGIAVDATFEYCIAFSDRRAP